MKQGQECCILTDNLTLIRAEYLAEGLENDTAIVRVNEAAFSHDSARIFEIDDIVAVNNYLTEQSNIYYNKHQKVCKLLEALNEEMSRRSSAEGNIPTEAIG